MYLITILIKNINNNPPPSPSLKATWLTATTTLLPSVRLATAMSTREIAPYLDRHRTAASLRLRHRRLLALALK
jgi:hypothetical protein